MFDEYFAAVLPLSLVQLGKKMAETVIREIGQVLWRAVSEWTICSAMSVGQRRANRNLDSLDRVHNQNSKFAVEDILIPNDVQVGSLNKHFGVRLTPEWVEITAKPIIIHRRKDFDEMITVCYKPA